MKLRNRKTGEIAEFRYIQSDHVAPLVLTTYENDKPEMYTYNSLAELNAEWEDYEEPKSTIKDVWFNSTLANGHFVEIDFISDEEAEKAVEKLKAWKRLKDKGVKLYGWRRNHTGTYDFLSRWEGVPPKMHEIINDLDLLFGGEE